MTAILVTDGEQRSALAVVRALGASGYKVFTCSPVRRSLAGGSRYCQGEATVPNPLQMEADFIAHVERLVEKWRIDVLLPVTDASLLALLPARGRFPSVRIPFPGVDIFRAVSNKVTVLEAAPRFGIAVPPSTLLTRPEDRASVDLKAVRFPVVVKSGHSLSEVSGLRRRVGVHYAQDPNQLVERLTAYRDEDFPLLLQERVQGPGMGVFFLLWQGQTLGVFAHRRLREKPPSGGVSTYCESIAADPELVERSSRLLQHFGWQGPAMVEYKLDSGTGTPYLMEVNPRFWGSLQLAIHCGVDFPTLLVRAALSERPDPVTDYRTGERLRWWWGDVDQLLARLLRSREHLELPPDVPGRWRAIGDFAGALAAGTPCQVLRASDLRPFLRETVRWIMRR